MYRCVAASVQGFVQQVAVSIVGKGYLFYVAGKIPERKDPQKTDAKILSQYEIELSKWARARRKRKGRANLQYLRCGHFYVIFSTHGEHPFFEAEKTRVKDIRETPLKFSGYSISYRKEWGGGKYHPSVRIEKGRYLELKSYFLEVATHRSVENLVAEFRRLPFEPYAPVRNQIFCILRAVNRARKEAGFEPVPLVAIFRRRVSVRAFLEEGGTWKERGGVGRLMGVNVQNLKG